MNSVNLTGNIATDIELRETTTGTKVARFNLAVRRDKENTDFIRCIAFNKTAELIESFMRKGTKMGLTGRIQTGSYEKDGKKVYTTDVIVNEIDFLESKKEETKKPDDGFMAIPDGVDDEGLPWN